MQEVFEKIIEKLEEERRKKIDLMCLHDRDELRYIHEFNELKDVLDIVEQAAAEYNNGWIPCSERLPEEGRGVILYAENKAFIGSHVVFMANIHNGKWQMWETSREVEINYIPIAWQPLSLLLEPYQQEGRESEKRMETKLANMGGKEKSRRYTIYAVDFDGTLCENVFPDIGKPNMALIKHLIKRRNQGNKVILWTCRKGERLQEAIEWCRKYNLEFDCVNQNLPEIIKQWGRESRKVFADVYIDDKAVNKPKYCVPYKENMK